MSNALLRPATVPVAEHRCHCGVEGAFGYQVDGSWQWFCARHRLRRWSADACNSEMEANFVRAELGVENIDPPDLQALVAAHGGYDRITLEAWAEYHRAMAKWQAQRREKYRRR